MEPTQAVRSGSTLVPALVWGAMLAYYSWLAIELLVHRLVARVTRTGRAPRGWSSMMLALGKWLLYAGWLYAGLVWARLSPWALGLGFLLGWSLGVVHYARVRGQDPVTVGDGHESAEVHHGAV